MTQMEYGERGLPTPALDPPRQPSGAHSIPLFWMLFFSIKLAVSGLFENHFRPVPLFLAITLHISCCSLPG